jgi:hypothetical protein
VLRQQANQQDKQILASRKGLKVVLKQHATAKAEKVWQRKTDLCGQQGRKTKEDGRKTASQNKDL